METFFFLLSSHIFEWAFDLISLNVYYDSCFISCYFIFFMNHAFDLDYFPYKFWARVVIFSCAEFLSLMHHFETFSGILLPSRSTVPFAGSSLVSVFLFCAGCLIPRPNVGLHGRPSLFAILSRSTVLCLRTSSADCPFDGPPYFILFEKFFSDIFFVDAHYFSVFRHFIPRALSLSTYNVIALLYANEA